MTNTPLSVIDNQGRTITVLSDDYGIGIANAGNTATTIVELDSRDSINFPNPISSLPAGDFLFVTSAKKQDIFSAGQAIAINKDLFKRCIDRTSGSAIVFKRIYGTIEVTESLANVTAQLQDTGGGSGTFNQLSGDVVSGVTGGATTIQAGVVTNAKLATVPTATLKGRSTAGTGAPTDLTAAQVKTILALDQVDNTSDANKPISDLTAAAIGAKQDTLVSGTNIKTINGTSILGSGNIVVSGGSSLTVTTVGTAIFQYEILTGTPVIGYTKTGGAGNGVMTCTGGTIKLRQFTDDILAADMAASPGSIRFDLVGTGTNIKLARSFIPTKYTLNATDALADASTSGTTSNQVDVDNTPPVKYGNIVLTGHGAMSIRLDNVVPDLGISFKW